MNILVFAGSIISLFIYNIVQAVILLLTPRRFRKKKDITGQKILITGAGNGLGRHLAIEFSRHATCLVLLDISKKALQDTVKLLDPKSRVFIYECDVTNRKQVYAVADIVKIDIGDVDILVNNAGIVNGKSLLDLPDEKVTKTVEVNALSHFWICKSFLPSMMAKNRGHIVTIASVAGRSGCPKLTDYCASKFAAIGFCESLELEMRSKMLDGIKFTIACPSHFDSGLFDGLKVTFGKLLSQEYVAHEIMNGILEEMETIFIPSYFNYILMLKAIVPRWLVYAVYEKSGNINAMENFRGRSTNNNAAVADNGKT